MGKHYGRLWSKIVIILLCVFLIQLSTKGITLCYAEAQEENCIISKENETEEQKQGNENKEKTDIFISKDNMSYIKENISWIKDIVGVAISILTLLLAFFTYRRARSTIFQPLRTDVIKHQAEIIEQLVNIVNNEVDFIKEIDYYYITVCNFYLIARTYGFIFDEQVYDEINDLLGGTLYLNEDNYTVFPPLVVNRPPTEGEPYELPKTANDRDKRQEEAKSGNVEFTHIRLTKKHINTVKAIRTIASNPWLSKKIKKHISQLLQDIDSNLHNAVPYALQQGIKEMCETANLNEHPIILPGKIYNIALHVGKRHGKQLEKIKKTIRKQLRVDKKW